MSRLRWLLLTLILMLGAAHAHRDRILTIRSDGSIPEIPASFGRVFLKVSNLGSPTPTVQFSSGTQRNDLPPCVTRLISARQQSDLLLTGSWYHDESRLPYYVNVEFHDPGHVPSRTYNSSLNILFNLRTARVINIKRFVADPSGNGGRYQGVTLSASGCTLDGMRPNTSSKPNPLRGPP